MVEIKSIYTIENVFSTNRTWVKVNCDDIGHSDTGMCWRNI